jgi:plasmid maintenance system antidote protein VapI
MYTLLMQALQALIDQSGLPICAVARATGMHRDTVQKHLADKRKVGKKAAFRYACLFDVAPTVFLYPEESNG